MAIPGLSGPEQLTIPAGVQAGSTIRLARRGLPSLSRAGRGDQVVRVGVETPVALSSEQAALLSGLAEQRPRRAAQLRRWSRT
jgi:molecular chaperone DnaJ